MNITFTIRRVLGDLAAREYDFDVVDNDLRCIRYRALSRATKRQQKETTHAFWSWYPHDRQRRIGEWIPALKVPYDESISIEARQVLMSQVKVVAPGEG